MASDQQQLKKAFEKHEALAQQKAVSVAADVGITAVLYSSYQEWSGQLDTFYREALRFQRAFDNQDKPVQLYKCTSRDTVLEVIEDPQVSSIITVGNGSFSEFWVPKKIHTGTRIDRPDKLDWYRVAQATTHLKLGSFAHRTCGHYTRSMNVPFATFLMSDMTTIKCAVGKVVTDEDPDESAFKQVFGLPQPSLKGIHAVIKGMHKPKS